MICVGIAYDMIKWLFDQIIAHSQTDVDHVCMWYLLSSSTLTLDPRCVHVIISISITTSYIVWYHIVASSSSSTSILSNPGCNMQKIYSSSIVNLFHEVNVPWYHAPAQTQRSIDQRQRQTYHDARYRPSSYVLSYILPTNTRNLPKADFANFISW